MFIGVYYLVIGGINLRNVKVQRFVSGTPFILVYKYLLVGASCLTVSGYEL